MRVRPLLRVSVMAAVLMSLSACCFDLLWFLDSKPGGGGSGSPEPDVSSYHPECTSEAFDLGWVLDAGVPSDPAEGTSDVSMSPRGCYRYRRVVTGGVLTSRSIVHDTGRFVVVQDGGSSGLMGIERVMLEVTVRGDGQTSRFDVDEDGVVEETIEETWNGELLGSFARELKDSSGALIRRDRTVATTPGRARHTVEVLEAGALVLRDDFDVSTVQRQTGACYANAENLTDPKQNPFPCPPEVMERLRQEQRNALQTFHDCMSNLDGPLSDRVRLLDLLMSGEYLTMATQCFSSKKVYAAVDIEHRYPVLYVNVNMMKCDASDFIRSALGHEMLHVSRRNAHDPALEKLFENGRIGHRIMEMADETYACQALCESGPYLNRCSCARCLRTTACDERCQSVNGCVVWRSNPDGGAPIAITSEAVGASCSGGWWGSLAECRGSCSKPAECKGYSVSCEPGCQ